MKKMSIVIPSYNEEQNIKLIYDELVKLFSEINYNKEFIFVNDGSSDRTIKEIKKISIEDYEVKLIDFSRNFGKEAAILAGLDYASGDCTIIIDADLQMPVGYIVDMIEEWEKGAKLVLTYKERRNSGLKSKLASKYYDVYNKMSDTSILKDALDYQLMDCEIVDVITSMRERQRYFKGLTGFIGYDYVALPVSIDDRQHGESSFSTFKTLFSYAFKSFALHSGQPLIFAIRIGVLLSLFSFILLVYTIAETLIKQSAGSGFATIVSIMLFMFGILFLFLGVMGYYLYMMYTEVKQRPNYIVNEMENIRDGNR